MDSKEPVTPFPFAKLTIPCPSHSDRLTAFFRLFCALPVLIVLMLLVGIHSKGAHCVGGGLLILPALLAILFRKRYPRWWFDWNYSLMKFATRIISYLLLLRDEYPAFEEDQSVSLELRYPDAVKELSQGMPLVKWFLAIPHLIIMALLLVAVVLMTVVAWFAILFTAKYPAGIHEFVVGVLRWSLRVNAYAFLLITDVYPPFRLSE
jgi:hypothetical protein